MFFVADDQAQDNRLSMDVNFSDQQMDELIANANYLLCETDRELKSYLVPMYEKGIAGFFLFPVLVEGSLAAVICIGYQHFLTIADSDLALGREFADRVAIGLSKSSWEKQLYYQAHYDVLTRLPNRLLVTDRLHQAISRAKRNNACTAVMFIDIDRFKTSMIRWDIRRVMCY